MKYLLLCAIFGGIFGRILAQDVHFSQFDHAPLFLNPTQTGLFSGDYRVAANYRSQWFSVPVPYSTFSASFDGRLLPNKLQNDVLGGGILLVRDQAGDSKLSTLSIAGKLAFAKRLTDRVFASAGAYIGYGQRRFKLDGLRFDDQYNGDQFDPNRISGDLNNLTNRSIGYLDFGMGAGVRWQRSRRDYFNLGLAIFHLNSPKASFMGTDATLHGRMVFHANASLRLHYQLDFLPTIQYQQQHNYQELVVGGYLKYHLNQNLGRETAVSFGCLYRQRDAIIPAFVLHYQTWQFGLSYDVNVSPFQVATNRNGALELSLIYIFQRIPAMGVKKMCPIL